MQCGLERASGPRAGALRLGHALGSGLGRGRCALPVRRLRARCPAAGGLQYGRAARRVAGAGRRRAQPGDIPPALDAECRQEERLSRPSEQPPHLAAQARQQLPLEPGIGLDPGVVAPGGMRQRQRARRAGASSATSRQRPTASVMLPLPAVAQMPALRIAADQQDQLQLRHGREQARVPGGRAFAPRRQVAAGRIMAGKAEAHGHDGDAPLVVELLAADARARRAADPRRGR